jgi:hypothetical protein
VYHGKFALSQQEKSADAIKKIAENIDGVKEISIYVTPLISVD